MLARADAALVGDRLLALGEVAFAAPAPAAARARPQPAARPASSPRPAQGGGGSRFSLFGAERAARGAASPPRRSGSLVPSLFSPAARPPRPRPAAARSKARSPRTARSTSPSSGSGMKLRPPLLSRARLRFCGAPPPAAGAAPPARAALALRGVFFGSAAQGELARDAALLARARSRSSAASAEAARPAAPRRAASAAADGAADGAADDAADASWRRREAPPPPAPGSPRAGAVPARGARRIARLGLVRRAPARRPQRRGAARARRGRGHARFEGGRGTYRSSPAPGLCCRAAANAEVLYVFGALPPREPADPTAGRRRWRRRRRRPRHARRRRRRVARARGDRVGRGRRRVARGDERPFSRYIGGARAHAQDEPIAPAGVEYLREQVGAFQNVPPPHRTCPRFRPARDVCTDLSGDVPTCEATLVHYETGADLAAPAAAGDRPTTPRARAAAARRYCAGHRRAGRVRGGRG